MQGDKLTANMLTHQRMRRAMGSLQTRTHHTGASMATGSLLTPSRTIHGFSWFSVRAQSGTVRNCNNFKNDKFARCMMLGDKLEANITVAD